MLKNILFVTAVVSAFALGVVYKTYTRPEESHTTHTETERPINVED